MPLRFGDHNEAGHHGLQAQGAGGCILGNTRVSLYENIAYETLLPFQGVSLAGSTLSNPLVFSAV